MDYSDFITTANPATFSVKNILQQSEHAAMQSAYQSYYGASAGDPYGNHHQTQTQSGFSNMADAYANAVPFSYGNSGSAGAGGYASQSPNAATFNGLYSMPGYLNARHAAATHNHHHHSSSSSVAHLPLTSPHVQQLYDLKPPTTTALNAEALISELTSQSGNDKRKLLV